MMGVYAFLIILFLGGFFLGLSLGKIIFDKKYPPRSIIYLEALKIFYEWKNEIGGVSLKGVGQYYEKWINEKIQKASNNAGENTEKTPRKTQ